MEDPAVKETSKPATFSDVVYDKVDSELELMMVETIKN